VLDYLSVVLSVDRAKSLDLQLFEEIDGSAAYLIR
jgi:hypothetical protein